MEILTDIPTQAILYPEIHLQKEGVACFPKLSSFPIYGGFSWGRENMSLAYAHDSASQDAVRKHVKDWLGSIGIGSDNPMVNITPADKTGIPGDSANVLEVTEEVIRLHASNNPDYTPAKAEFIYTKEKDITLSVKPADCPSVIVYAKNKNGEDIVGIGHWGRAGVDSMNPYLAISHLIQEEGCSPQDIHIGIAPGIGPQFHTLTYNDIVPADSALSKLQHWQEWFGRGSMTIDEEHNIVHVDLLKEILWQLHQHGIPGENIEAYTMDTYQEALAGNTFSHRYANVSGNENGRMIVAASLS